MLTKNYQEMKNVCKIPLWPILLFIGLITCKKKDQGKNIETRNFQYNLDDKNTPNDSVKIEFISNTTIDIGYVKVGDTIKRVFKYKNIGDSPFLIHSAEATCGCTVAYFNDQPLPKGKIDSITGVFVSDEHMLGFINKVITVRSNSPLSPFLFTLYGRVD